MNKFIARSQSVLFILLGVFIPTSIAITNFIIGLISFFWILEGGLKIKWEKIKSSKWIAAIFFLIILYGIGMLWGETHANAGWQFQRLALLLFFPVLMTININQQSIRYGAAIFLITNFISAFSAILINHSLISPLSEYISLINSDWTVSAFIKYNYHNVLLALSFALCLYLIAENKTKYKKTLIFFILIYAFSIFTERGRAGQVIFNLTAFFYIIYYNRSRILTAILFFGVLFSFQYLIYHSTNVYKDRFDVVSDIIKNNGQRPQDKLEDIRYVFVKNSIQKIFKKPVLGHGTGSFGSIFKKEVNSGHYFDVTTTPHNQYLYVWFELGILGLILLLATFYFQIKSLFRKPYGVQRILLPISFLFLMLVDSYLFIFILTISYIYLYTIYSRYELE